MNWKRLAFAAGAVFIAQAIVAGALQMVVADQLFADEAFFRPEGEEKLFPYFLSRVLFVALFAYLFAKSSRRVGWAPGLRYGLLIWLFYSVPMTIGFWSFIAIPDGLAVAWIGIGLAEYLVGGVVVGFLYRPGAGGLPTS